MIFSVLQLFSDWDVVFVFLHEHLLYHAGDQEQLSLVQLPFPVPLLVEHPLFELLLVKPLAVEPPPIKALLVELPHLAEPLLLTQLL